MRIAITTLLVLPLLTACGGGAAPPAPPRVPTFTAQAAFPRLESEIVDWYLARYPTLRPPLAEAGARDTLLGSYFAGDLERARHDARALLTRLGEVNRPTLAREDYFDYALLEAALRSELFELEELNGFARDPRGYAWLVSFGVRTLYASELAPDARARALAARMRQVPLLFRAARQNLAADRVPRLFVEEAIAEVERARAALGEVRVQGLPAGEERALENARAAALASVDSFGTWLERDLMPRATGRYGLGPERLAELLRLQRFIDVPLAEIDSLNRQAIDEYREWMTRVAMDLDPLQHAEELIERLLGAERVGMLGERTPGGSFDPVALRPHFPPPGVEEAIAHYGDLATAADETVGGADRILAIRRALHAHALLHAVLRLHAADATIDGAASDISRLGLVPLDVARREARRLAYDPAYGLIALDRMQLFALAERLAAQRGRAIDRADFVAELRRTGLPIPLAAEAMLGREPGRLLVIGRRTPGVPEPPRLGDPR